MLAIYKNTEQGLLKFDDVVNGGWISAIDPTPEEIERLKSWGIASDLINYSLDLDEMSHIERDEDYTFILLRIPRHQEAGDTSPYNTIPLGIILTNRYVVTIGKFENDIIRALYNGKFRGLRTTKRYRFALYVFLETATRYLSYLREINKTVEVLEEQLQKSTRNRELLEILKFQKSLVYFTTGLKSNQVVLEHLQRVHLFKQFEEDQDLLEDVLTENKQAIEMTDIASNILSSMMDAFASIISNNLNVVMKALAAITIIVSLPTIVFSYYGMNVSLPLAGHTNASIFTLALALLFTGIAIWIFVKRDWF